MANTVMNLFPEGDQLVRAGVPAGFDLERLSDGSDEQPFLAGGSVDQADAVVGVLREVASGLPGLLAGMSSELLARHQQGGLRVDGGGPGLPSVEVAVGIARLALAEATTAARLLARHLNDVGRVMAIIADTPTGER